MPAMQGTDMASAVALAIPKEDPPPFGHGLLKYFGFDDGWVNLNNGAFGSAPKAVNRVREHFQQLSERRPDTFIRKEFPRLLFESRTELAKVINAPPQSVVYVPNATAAVNVVLRGMVFKPGDKILYFDFVYGACGNTVEYICETTPASPVRVQIKLPISDDDLLAAFESAVAEGGVKIALFDTITSIPSLRLPFERLTQACKRHGILSLVDGAHGVGHIPLDMKALDPDFFTSNVHKWMFAPRGCALLYVPQRNKHLIKSTMPTSWDYIPADETFRRHGPLAIIEGDDSWARQFNFVGTIDNSNYLSVPTAIEFRRWLGGEAKIMAYIQHIARRGAEIMSKRFETEFMAGHTQVALYTVRLPLDLKEVPENERAKIATFLSDTSLDERDTYVPVFEYKGGLWCRISGQVYLEESDFERGADVLLELIDKIKSGEWVAELLKTQL